MSHPLNRRVAAPLSAATVRFARITPAVFMVAYEIARNEMRGPTVDGVQLGSMYGVIAAPLCV